MLYGRKTTTKRVFLVCSESQNRAELGASGWNALDVIVDLENLKRFLFVFGKTIWSFADESVGRAFVSRFARLAGDHRRSVIYVWFRSTRVKHTLNQRPTKDNSPDPRTCSRTLFGISIEKSLEQYAIWRLSSGKSLPRTSYDGFCSLRFGRNR